MGSRRREGEEEAAELGEAPRGRQGLGRVEGPGVLPDLEEPAEELADLVEASERPCWEGAGRLARTLAPVHHLYPAMALLHRLESRMDLEHLQKTNTSQHFEHE